MHVHMRTGAGVETGGGGTDTISFDMDPHPDSLGFSGEKKADLGLKKNFF